MPYTLEYDATRLERLSRRFRNGGRAELGQAVQKIGRRVQAQAIQNVSGHMVVFQGGAFVVRPRTGALRGSISQQWPYGDPLVARVFVNGAMTAAESAPGFRARARAVSDYAMAIEKGHGPIDLKKTMTGKTVPFFAARSANAVGPYAATGLKQTGVAGQFRSATHDAKLMAKGKQPMTFTRVRTKTGGSSYFIAFRKVGREGWIIPAARPRPFLRAAGETVARDASKDLGAAVTALLR